MARKESGMIREYAEKLLNPRPMSQAALEGLATCAFADKRLRCRVDVLLEAGRVQPPTTLSAGST